MTSDAQRSLAGCTTGLLLRDALSGMVSGGLEGHAFFRVEFHVDGVSYGGSERRMASREQDAAAELHLEVDVLAEKHFLVDPSFPDVVSLGPRFGEVNVFRAHRQHHAVIAAQIVARQNLDVADRSEEHTSELQSPYDLVCRLLLEKKKKKANRQHIEKEKKKQYLFMT